MTDMDEFERPIDRTLPELISQLATDLAALVRKESELVRTEVSEKVEAVERAAGELAVGGLLLLGAFVVLLLALVLGISQIFGIDLVWSALIVGIAVAVVGYVLVRAAMKVIRLKNLPPERSIRQLAKTAQLAKGH